MIITVSREFGAGGAQVAAEVARALGWTLVDNQYVDEVARRAGMSPEEVERQEERAPGFLERLARTLANATSEYVTPDGSVMPEMEEARLVKITETVVAEYAAQGRVVMVGRAAPAVLEQVQDAIHVRIVAPRGHRVATVAARRGVSEDEAEEIVRDRDRARARYHKMYYDREWTDPVNYHMVLNSAVLGVTGAAEVVVGRARRVWQGVESRE